MATQTLSQTITPLSTTTQYFVRAYSHNSIGYSYGNEVSFTTVAKGKGGGILAFF